MRASVRLVFLAGVERLLWRCSSSSIIGIPPEDFALWLDRMEAALNVSELAPVIVWPSDPNRGRVYVHLLDRAGRPVAFVKIGLDALNNRLVENERRALGCLASLPLHTTRVPDVISAGEIAGKQWLAVQPTPPKARPTNWEPDLDMEASFGEWAGPIRRISLADAEKQWWWQRFTDSREIQGEFLERIRSVASAGVDVCRVHGDLNHTNVLREGRQIWLLDWEQSSDTAPCLTDSICAEVDKLWPTTRRNPAAALEIFLSAQWNPADEPHRDRVLLALAFLVGAGFTPAFPLVSGLSQKLSKKE